MVDIFFYLIVAFHRQADHHSVPRLNFLDIAERFFINIPLGRQSNHRHAFDDQRQCSMLEFPCRISLGMDIGNLFQFQRTFHRDRIIDRAADEKHIIIEPILLGKGLDFLAVGQEFFRLLRQFAQFMHDGLEPVGAQAFPQLRQIQGQHQHDQQLGRVGFGRCHGNFRSGPGINHLVGFTGDRRTDDIGHCQRPGAETLCFLHRGQ